MADQPSLSGHGPARSAVLGQCAGTPIAHVSPQSLPHYLGYNEAGSGPSLQAGQCTCSLTPIDLEEVPRSCWDNIALAIAPATAQ